MSDDKKTHDDKVEFFKMAMDKFMLNKIDDLENDKFIIKNRVIMYDIDVDTYYDMIVNHVRLDYAKYVFRQIRELIDMYL